MKKAIAFALEHSTQIGLTLLALAVAALFGDAVCAALHHVLARFAR